MKCFYLEQNLYCFSTGTPEYSGVSHLSGWPDNYACVASAAMVRPWATLFWMSRGDAGRADWVTTTWNGFYSNSHTHTNACRSPAGGRSAGGRSASGRSDGRRSASGRVVFRLESLNRRPGPTNTTLGRATHHLVALVNSPVGRGPTRPQVRPRETSKEARGLFQVWALGHYVPPTGALKSTDNQTRTRTVERRAFIKNSHGGDISSPPPAGTRQQLQSWHASWSFNNKSR